MQIQKKPAGCCGGRPFQLRVERLGHDTSRVGMVMMMMPGEGLECHKEKL
jgi:hypothetical protein